MRQTKLNFSSAKRPQPSSPHQKESQKQDDIEIIEIEDEDAETDVQQPAAKRPRKESVTASKPVLHVVRVQPTMAKFMIQPTPKTMSNAENSLHSLVWHYRATQQPSVVPHPRQVQRRLAHAPSVYASNACATFERSQNMFLHISASQYASTTRQKSMAPCAQQYLVREHICGRMAPRHEALYLPGWAMKSFSSASSSTSSKVASAAQYRLVDSHYVSSLEFQRHGGGGLLASGTTSGVVRIFDFERYLALNTEATEREKFDTWISKKNSDVQEYSLDPATLLQQRALMLPAHRIHQQQQSSFVTKKHIYETHCFPVGNAGASKISSTRWSGSNLFVSFSNAKQVQVYDVTRENGNVSSSTSVSPAFYDENYRGSSSFSKPLHTISLNSEVMDTAISEERNCVVCACRSGELFIVDKRAPQPQPPAPSRPATAATSSLPTSRPPTKKATASKPSLMSTLASISNVSLQRGGSSSAGRSPISPHLAPVAQPQPLHKQGPASIGTSSRKSSGAIFSVVMRDNTVISGTENGSIDISDIRFGATGGGSAQQVKTLRTSDLIERFETDMSKKTRHMSSHQLKSRYDNAVQRHGSRVASEASFTDAVEIDDSAWSGSLRAAHTSQQNASNLLLNAALRTGQVGTSPVDSVLLHPTDANLVAFSLAGGQVGLVDLLPSEPSLCKLYRPISLVEQHQAGTWAIRKRQPCFMSPLGRGGTFLCVPQHSDQQQGLGGLAILDWSIARQCPELYAGQLARGGSELQLLTTAMSDDKSMVVRSAIPLLRGLSPACVASHGPTGYLACGLAGEPIVVLQPRDD